jgi:hypothetical protein
MKTSIQESFVHKDAGETAEIPDAIQRIRCGAVQAGVVQIVPHGLEVVRAATFARLWLY